MATDVKIDIAAEYTGKKAFDKAEKQVAMLTSQVKKLAGAFGVTFGAAQLARYAQNAVKAFADSQLEAVQLTNAVKNLGLAFASRDLDIYIDKVERATGINRDQLQPAMIKLLQVTGSVAKSQELLNLAMDVAAGTGQDLTSTSEKLSQAYVGNFKGLRSLNLGLTQAELKSTNFEEVQKRLQVLFAGQATAAADSYVGSLNKLSIASEQASEKIGKSLLDALTAISGGKTIDDTVKKIDTLSSAIAGLIDTTIGLKAGEYLQQYYGLQQGKIPNGFGNRSMSVLGQDTQKSDLAARKKAEAEAAKRAKQLLAMQNAALKAQKDALKLAKAKATFDLQKIQIEAALKGKLSEEDRIRLKLMKAIEEENLSDIEKYEKALDAAQAKTKELADALAAIKASEAANPFAKWADYVKEAIDLTNSVAQASLEAGISAGAKLSEALSGARYAAQGAAAAEAAANAAAISGAYNSAATAASKAAADQAAALKASQDALIAQGKMSSDALQALGAEQLAALKNRLAEEAAAYKELMDATKAAAEAALLTGANDYTTGNLAKIASEAAAAAAAAASASSAANAASNNSSNANSTINVTVSGDPFTDPNVVAEKVVEIIREAGKRGTVDVLGFI